MLDPSPPPHVAAAATIPPPDLASLQHQLQQLVTLMTASAVGAPTPTPASRGPNNQPARNTSHGRGGRGRSGGGRGQPGPSPRMYCWSHGACAHTSADCNNPHPGHQPTATFTSMQGGSTMRCFWLPV